MTPFFRPVCPLYRSASLRESLEPAASPEGALEVSVCLESSPERRPSVSVVGARVRWRDMRTREATYHAVRPRLLSSSRSGRPYHAACP